MQRSEGTGSTPSAQPAPGTQAGKERARLNATKHGLAVKAVVLRYKNMGSPMELQGAMLSQYEPECPAEMFLVDQMAQRA